MDLALELDDRPDSPAAVAVPLTRSEREIGRTVANLLDGELERRAPTEGPGWIAEQLGVSADALRPATFWLSGWRYVEAAWGLAVAIEASGAPVAPTAWAAEPIWFSWPVPEGSLHVPAALATVLPAGTLHDGPVGVQVSQPPRGEFVHFTLFTPGNARLAGGMDRLYDLAADSLEQPLRGRTLRVTGRRDLEVATQAPHAATRADLALPADVWRKIDTNVHGLFRNRDVLRRLGLNRGVLLTGPPGTGKTHLCQVVASELAGENVTVLLPDPDAAQAQLVEIYELATWLAPSLVVLEDIDLIAGRRGVGNSTSLVDLLVAIDGMMTRHAGVVTMATTNDAKAIDDAAKRAARFDRIIDLPPPDARGRHRVWERYLRDLDSGFDLDLLARRSDGATGADVREVVRRAVLEGDGEVTEALLLRLVREARFAGDGPLGQYL